MESFLSTKLKKIKEDQLAAIIFIIFIFLFYGNTLSNGFVQDDVPQIRNNIYLRSLENLPKVITGCLWEYANKGCEGRTFYYRPIQYFSYFLTYQVSSKAWFFHLMNLLYLFCAVFLVFLLAKILSKNFLFGFVSALIFLIHPINSEVVNWVSANSDALFTIFLLLSAIFYIRYRDSGYTRYLLLVYLFYFFGLLSKETAFVLPLILLAIDFLFFEVKLKEIFRWQELKKYLFFAVPFAIYYLMRLSVVGKGSYFGDFSFLGRIYLSITLLARYIFKLFWPYPLQAIYDTNFPKSFFNFPFFLAIIADLALVCISLFALKKQKNLLVFSAVWFIVFLLPPIIFLQAAGAGMSLFFERYLFASSIGFALFVGYLLCYVININNLLKERSVKSILAKVLIIAFVFLLFFASWQRNKAWKDDETLYIATLSQVPRASNLRFQLGNIYLAKGELEKAKQEFEKAIDLNKEWKDITMAYKGLGDYYRAKNDLDNTIAFYQKAIETTTLSARDFIVFNDLGVAYMDKGAYLKGAVYFCQSLGLLPSAETVNNNFNAALLTVESAYIQKGILYQKVAEELKESSEWRIQHLGKSCSEKTCAYSFSFVQGEQDILLAPFITAVISGSEKEIEIKGSNFNQEQGIFEVQLEKSYSKKEIDFIFPSCRGIYYRVTVLPR